MRKFTLLVGLGMLVTVMTGADGGGCFGGGSDPDPQPDAGAVANYPRTCTADTDCDTTEVCHPIGFVCVKNCANDSTVCGDEFCVETTFNGKTASVCKCETCPTGEVCSEDLDDVCETRCTSSADCQAFEGQDRVCNEDGLCVFVPASPCDPACTNGQICDDTGAVPVCVDPCTASSCNLPGLSKCNSTTKLCEPCSQDSDCESVPDGDYRCDKSGQTPVCVSTATSCNPAVLQPGLNDGPDTCNYGEVCSSATNTCVATLPDGTCATGYSWNPSLKGPVIVILSNPQSFQGSSTPCNGLTDRDCCGPAAGATGRGGGMGVDIEFYAPAGISASGWQATADSIKFIDPTGAVMSAGHFADYPSAGATYSNAALHAGVCTKNGSTAEIDPSGWSVYLVDSAGAGGNPACL